jgi:hypothetical protein
MEAARSRGRYAPYPVRAALTPFESHGREGGREPPCAPLSFFLSETLNVGRMLLATYHKQTRNIDANICRWMLRGRRFATLNTIFRNIVKVFCNIPTRRPPNRRLIEAFIQIVWRNARPTLAPGSDVRALAVPFF